MFKHTHKKAEAVSLGLGKQRSFPMKVPNLDA